MSLDPLLGRRLIPLSAVPVLTCLLTILMVLPLPETPKFLLLNRGNEAAAVESLRYYQGL